MNQRAADRIRTGPVALVAVVAVVVAGCETPSVPSSSEAGQPPADVATPSPTISASADPAAAAVADAHALLKDSLEQAQRAFEALAAADDEDTAARAGDTVRALAAEPDSLDVVIVEDPDGARALTAPPLLPGPAQSREETIDHGDALTAATTAARDAGARGSALLDVVRDPIAGDLGAWQRDAAGLLDLAASTARSAASIEEAEQTVGEVPGEALRALVWALIAADADEPTVRRAAGERGGVHVSLMLQAVESVQIPA